MKITSQVFLLLLLLGCSAVKHNSQPQEYMILDVVRITQKEEVLYELPHDPAFYPTAKITFSILSPEELKGMKIELPIIEGLEDPMFDKEEFTLKIPKDYKDSFGFNFKYLIFDRGEPVAGGDATR